MAHDVVAAWHDVVRTRDLKALAALLAEDVVFQSPVVHTPQKGKAVALQYLTAAMLVLNTDAFRYLHEWRGPSSAVLEFVTQMQTIEINGADFIFWNEDGLITRFKVMLRPLKAITLVHQMMGAQLAGGAAPR